MTYENLSSASAMHLHKVSAWAKTQTHKNFYQQRVYNYNNNYQNIQNCVNESTAQNDGNATEMSGSSSSSSSSSSGAKRGRFSGRCGCFDFFNERERLCDRRERSTFIDRNEQSSCSNERLYRQCFIRESIFL